MQKDSIKFRYKVAVIYTAEIPGNNIKNYEISVFHLSGY